MSIKPDPAQDVMRVIPQAFDAERDVLGGLLCEGPLADDVFAIVQPADFYHTYNQQIAECILAVHRNKVPIDLTTVMEELRRRDWLDEVGGPGYLQALEGHGLTRFHTLKYARIVANRATARDLIAAGREAVEIGYEAPEDALAAINQCAERFLAIAKRSMGGKRGLRAWQDSGEDFEDIYARAVAGRRELSAARLGIDGLDKTIGPLSDQRVIVLLGKRGQGKTQLAVNAVMSTAYELRNRKEHGQVLVFSFESEGMYKERGLSWASHVDNRDILHGFPGNDPGWQWQRKALDDWWPELPTFPVSDCEDVTDEDGVEAQWRIHAKRCPVKLVVVDYWQAMNRRLGRREIEEYDKLALRFKDLANEYACPTLILSQETYDKQTKTASAKNSKTIEEVATMVVRLGEDSKFSCEKMRRGMAFGVTKLVLDKATSRAWTEEAHERLMAMGKAYGGGATESANEYQG